MTIPSDKQTDNQPALQLPELTPSERQIVKRMAELRELLATFGLRLHGYDPGVSCARAEGGRLLDFESHEWAVLEPLLIEPRDTRARVDGGVARVDETELRESTWGFCPERGRGNAILSVEGELTLLGERLVRGLIARFFHSQATPCFVPDPRHWQPVDDDAATAPLAASVEDQVVGDAPEVHRV